MTPFSNISEMIGLLRYTYVYGPPCSSSLFGTTARRMVLRCRIFAMSTLDTKGLYQSRQADGKNYSTVFVQ